MAEPLESLVASPGTPEHGQVSVFSISATQSAIRYVENLFFLSVKFYGATWTQCSPASSAIVHRVETINTN